MAEWLKAADCKSARIAYAGSNPAPSTIFSFCFTKKFRSSGSKEEKMVVVLPHAAQRLRQAGKARTAVAVWMPARVGLQRFRFCEVEKPFSLGRRGGMRGNILELRPSPPAPLPEERGDAPLSPQGIPCRVLAFDCSVLCQLTLSHRSSGN